MDTTVYPDFDVDAELDRAQSNVDYHKAQARYFESQVRHLRRAADEQHELERIYGKEDRVLPLDVYDGLGPESVINDEMHALVLDERGDVDLLAYSGELEDDGEDDVAFEQESESMPGY